jgi:ATP-dependent helicase/nuclease subunit A
MNAVKEALAQAERSQRIAADPGKTVFVRANAGSGKTKVLVDRIARLLLEGAAPGDFLCITFTKAAAAEMQRRLFQRLGDWCVADDAKLASDLSALYGGNYDVSQETLARARALFARALETPGGLKIQTIHGFCQFLLARFPLEAGVAPGFEVADDTAKRDMQARAFSAIVADASLADAIAYQAKAGDAAALQKRLSRLERVGDVSDADIHQRHNSPPTFDALEHQLVTSRNWDDLQELIGALREGGAKERECAEKLIALRTRGGGLNAYLDAFLKSDGCVRANLPTKSFVARSPHLVQQLENLKAEAEKAAQDMRAAARVADTISALKAARAFLSAYAAQKDFRGVLDFDDLIVRAGALLNQSAAAAWVLYKLDGHIDHVLIDEGQDTSPLQWDLIRPIIEEFFVDENGRRALGERTVFAVGDPKQSIYSFQGADPEGFERESQKLSLAAGDYFTAPELTVSFRSTPEVLAAVDRVFQQPQAAMTTGPGVSIVSHVAKRAGETGCVELWPLAPYPEKVERDPYETVDAQPENSSIVTLAANLAACVKDWIQRGEAVWDYDKAADRPVLRPMRYSDILFLVRTRGPVFNQILKALKRQGLPVAGADRMKLNEEVAVQDLLNLMRVAIDPSDNLTLACLLKSPFIGLTDDDAYLVPLLHGRGHGVRAIDRLRAAQEPHYQKAAAFVEDLIAHAHLAPYPFLARVLERVDEAGNSGWRTMFARLGPEARDPMEELLSRALSAHARGVVTLQDFVVEIERDDGDIKREMEEAGAAIRLMTVHGSKGLEAPVVILPDTTGGFETKPDQGVMFENGAPFLVRDKTLDDPVSAAARAAFEARAERESARLLYVAMTRARDRLIVCGAARGNIKTGVESGAWYTLVEGGLAGFGEAFETPFGEGLRIGEALRVDTMPEAREDKAIAPPEFLLRPVRAAPPLTPWRAPSQIGAEGVMVSPRRAMSARLRRGTLIHGLLQRLPDVARDDRAFIAHAWLTQHGVADADAEAWIAECLDVLDDAAFAKVFGSGSRAEAAFASVLPNGERLRGAFDRLLITDADVLAIDFKTDRPSPKTPEATPTRILNQMAAYRLALQAIFPRRAVRCAIIWTDGPHLVELPESLLQQVWDARAS